MRRVTDVLDVWFDSGSMSFAQVHYPFENEDWFDHHFPGDFIVEYIGQTRGWFYTLHVLATAIFDRPAFSTCLSHGIVLGTDGQKMSKSLRNYPDVREVFDRDGADAMRWFLMSSPILRGGNLVVTEQGIRDSVRQVLIPLWNSWYFFTLYANAAGGGAGHDARSVRAHRRQSNPLDRYILAKLREYVAAMTDQLDDYDVAAACDSTRSFLDVLTNWYIRRSRERFWDEDADAFDTLYTVLEVVCRVTAPLLPLTTEEVWRGLTGERSVHLTDWPAADDLPADDALVASMDTVRDVCSAGSALRKAANLRNRLPLSPLTVVTEADLDRLRVARGRRGQRQGGRAASRPTRPRQRRTASRSGSPSTPARPVRASARTSSSRSRARSPATGRWPTTAPSPPAGWRWSRGSTPSRPWPAPSDDDTAIGMLPRGGFVVLDTAVTPELEAEGIARDLVRAVQQARKDAGLEVTDRIALTISAPAATLDAARTHEALIAEETLATSVAYADADEVSRCPGDAHDISGGAGHGRTDRHRRAGRGAARGRRRHRPRHGQRRGAGGRGPHLRTRAGGAVPGLRRARGHSRGTARRRLRGEATRWPACSTAGWATAST